VEILAASDALRTGDLLAAVPAWFLGVCGGPGEAGQDPRCHGCGPGRVQAGDCSGANSADGGKRGHGNDAV